MTYTFWHSGILIGTSALDHPTRNPGQRGGVFLPTTYGLAIFPRLTGILSAGKALKDDMDARGLDPEQMERTEVEEILERSPAGAKILDIGRMLSEVEVRDADGRTLAFESIGFSDLLELRQLAQDLGDDPTEELPELPPDAPRYLVSATFRKIPSTSETTANMQRHWSTLN